MPIRVMREAFNRANVWIDAAREAGRGAGVDLDDDEPTSATQRYLDDNDAWKQVTNFTKNELVEIWRPFNDRMAAERHRGPAPESGSMDHLVHYLAWLNTGIDYATLSKMLGVKESRFEDNIGRARGYLFETLSQKWWVKVAIFQAPSDLSAYQNSTLPTGYLLSARRKRQYVNEEMFY